MHNHNRMSSVINLTDLYYTDMHNKFIVFNNKNSTNNNKIGIKYKGRTYITIVIIYYFKIKQCNQ